MKENILLFHHYGIYYLVYPFYVIFQQTQKLKILVSNFACIEFIVAVPRVTICSSCRLWVSERWGESSLLMELAGLPRGEDTWNYYKILI